MSRNKDYQRLLNSKKWTWTKKAVWERAGGLCEECRTRGKIVPGVDCHHVRPVETATTIAEMEALAYDVGNIRLLCIPCHQRVHKEAHNRTKEAVSENKQRQLQRFIDKYKPRH